MINPNLETQREYKRRYYAKLRADPVRWEAYQKWKHEYNAAYHADLKSDPAAYEARMARQAETDQIWYQAPRVSISLARHECLRFSVKRDDCDSWDGCRWGGFRSHRLTLSY